MKMNLKKHFKIAIGLGLLSLILTAGQPSWAAAPLCSEVFSTMITSDPDLVMRAWYLRKIKNHDDRFLSQLTVDGVIYRDLLLLGGGREAYVYLGTNSRGPVAIKVFHNDSLFKIGLNEIKTYQQWLPKLLVADSRARAVITEYKEGIDVQEISEHGHELGVNAADRANIEDRWRTWVREQKAPFFSFFKRKSSFINQNVIYSFKDDAFYLIDAF